MEITYFCCCIESIVNIIQVISETFVIAQCLHIVADIGIENVQDLLDKIKEVVAEITKGDTQILHVNILMPEKVPVETTAIAVEDHILTGIDQEVTAVVLALRLMTDMTIVVDLLLIIDQHPHLKSHPVVANGQVEVINHPIVKNSLIVTEEDLIQIANKK